MYHKQEERELSQAEIVAKDMAESLMRAVEVTQNLMRYMPNWDMGMFASAIISSGDQPDKQTAEGLKNIFTVLYFTKRLSHALIMNFQAFVESQNSQVILNAKFEHLDKSLEKLVQTDEWQELTKIGVMPDEEKAFLDEVSEDSKKMFNRIMELAGGTIPADVSEWEDIIGGEEDEK